MTDSKNEIYMLSRRDAVETKRLNRQHDILLRYTRNERIHPSIDRNKLEAIADIATGTGVWLEEVSKHLSALPTTTGKQRTYYGFDISAEQFPCTTASNVTLSIQDVMKPFPKKHHGKYDLVFVRLLVLALKEDQLVQAVQNVVALLKPGGYLQWDDFDLYGFSYFHPQPPRLSAIRKILNDFAQAQGFCAHLPSKIHSTLCDLGFENVQKSQYNVLGDPELEDLAREQRMEAHYALMPVALLRGGVVRSKLEANRETERMAREIVGFFEQGWVPDLRLQSVIGRKLVKGTLDGSPRQYKL